MKFSFKFYPNKDTEVDAMQWFDSADSLAELSEMLPEETISVDYSIKNEKIKHAKVLLSINGLDFVSNPGCYVVKTSDGNIYSMDPHIFEEIYTAVQ